MKWVVLILLALLCSTAALAQRSRQAPCLNCPNGWMGAGGGAATHTPTVTRTATATFTPSPTRTFTLTPTRTPTNTPAPSNTPTPTANAVVDWSASFTFIGDFEEASNATRLNRTGTTCGTDCNMTDTNGVAQDATNFVSGAASALFVALNLEDLSCNLTTTCDELNATSTGNVTWGCFARLDADVGGVNNRLMSKASNDFAAARNSTNDAGFCAITRTDNVAVFANTANTSWPADNSWHHLHCQYVDSADTLTVTDLRGGSSGADATATSIRDSTGTVATFQIARAGVGSYWDDNIDLCYVGRGLNLTSAQICRVCSCGFRTADMGCSCQIGTPTSYASSGRNADCGACSLPACNAAAP